MSATNQIIIPVVGSRPSLEHQNTHPSSQSPNTPTKSTTSSTTLPWKKTNSAFKKFKDRKDKKHLLALQDQN